MTEHPKPKPITSRSHDLRALFLGDIWVSADQDIVFRIVQATSGMPPGGFHRCLQHLKTHGDLSHGVSVELMWEAYDVIRQSDREVMARKFGE